MDLLGAALPWHWKHAVSIILCEHRGPRHRHQPRIIARWRAPEAVHLSPVATPYLWPLYGLLAVKWQLLDDFRSSSPVGSVNIEFLAQELGPGRSARR